jgi:hypothetical protein
MPDLVEHLHSVIHPDFVRKADGHKLVLTDDNPQTTTKGFELHAGCRCLAVQLDFPPAGKYDRALPFFRRDVPGLTAKCDLIVFATNAAPDLGGKAFLVEMKSLNAGNSLTQMRSSAAFARYIIEVAKLHGVAVSTVEFRGVRIRTRRIPAKGRSRPPVPVFETHAPSKFQFCDWDAAFPLSLTALCKAC